MAQARWKISAFPFRSVPPIARHTIFAPGLCTYNRAEEYSEVGNGVVTEPSTRPLPFFDNAGGVPLHGMPES